MIYRQVNLFLTPTTPRVFSAIQRAARASSADATTPLNWIVP